MRKASTTSRLGKLNLKVERSGNSDWNWPMIMPQACSHVRAVVKPPV